MNMCRKVFFIVVVVTDRFLFLYLSNSYTLVKTSAIYGKYFIRQSQSGRIEVKICFYLVVGRTVIRETPLVCSVKKMVKSGRDE